MIAELLKPGEGLALSASTLCEITGMTPRELRRQVTVERIAGALICSSARGYFLAAGREELADFVKSSSARASTSRKVSRAFRDKLKEIQNQNQIPLPEN